MNSEYFTEPCCASCGSNMSYIRYDYSTAYINEYGTLFCSESCAARRCASSNIRYRPCSYRDVTIYRNYTLSNYNNTDPLFGE